jgi:hypothetical protein
MLLINLTGSLKITGVVLGEKVDSPNYKNN